MRRSFAASVTDEAQIAAMVDRVMTVWVRADIRINNAGIPARQKPREDELSTDTKV